MTLPENMPPSCPLIEVADFQRSLGNFSDLLRLRNDGWISLLLPIPTQKDARRMSSILRL